MSDEVPIVRLAGGWETVLAGDARAALEATALPRYLPAQRWFGGKARPVRAVRVVDSAPLRTDPLPAFLALVEIAFGDGATDLYFLPLAVVGPALAPPAQVVAWLSDPAGDAVLLDAVADPDVCRRVLTAVEQGKEVRTGAGVIRTVATKGYRDVCGDGCGSLEATLGPATSSNSLVFFGEQILLKVFRRLEEGINPDFEIGRFLTETGRFHRTPKMAGALEYHRPGRDVVTLAVLQQVVPNQGDGWQHVLGELNHYFTRAAARPDQPAGPDGRSLLELSESEPPAEAVAVIDTYSPIAGLLGRRTAEMHLALASDPAEPAFAPEPIRAEDVTAAVAEVRRQATLAGDTLRPTLGKLPADVQADARRLLDATPGFLDRLERSSAEPPAAAKLRCHGDYHLGQVLWADGDFVLLDFEGEPTRSVAERRARHSPLKDVAGMLRSLDYAAYAGLFAFTEGKPAAFERLRPWADLWQRWTAAAFLREYRAAAAGAPFLPADRAGLEALLARYLLGKAYYELVYELNNRPDWVRIPLRGLLALVTADAPG